MLLWLKSLLLFCNYLLLFCNFLQKITGKRARRKIVTFLLQKSCNIITDINTPAGDGEGCVEPIGGVLLGRYYLMGAGGRV